jgi:hypothetical protein
MAISASERWRRISYSARTRVADHPSVYLPYARMTHPAGGGKVLAGDTELMIEGFTRCANTFAVVAFQLAQPRPVRLAHHLHAPGHVIEATKLGVPTLVVSRPPEETILSTVIRQPFITLKQALRAYERFYSSILPHRESFVLATFEQVTADMGAVIRRINDRFATDFTEFEHMEANVEKVFSLIEERSRRASSRRLLADFQSGLIGVSELEQELARLGDAPDPQRLEEVVPRPSGSRNMLKVRLRGRYLAPGLEGLRSAAQRAYEALLSVDVPTTGEASA